MNGDQRKNGVSNKTEALLKISSREGEVLLLVAEGRTNREIAEELYLSERTVETHRANICDKFDLPGRGALLKWLSENWGRNQKE